MAKGSSPTENDQLDRKKTRSKIAENPQDPVLVFARRYQVFFDSTNDAIVVFNPKGEILDANPRFLKLCDSSYESVVSKSIFDLFDEESCEQIRFRFKILVEGRKRRTAIEAAFLSCSRRRRIVEVSLSLLKNQYGYPKTILAVLRDMTKRKEMENHLVQKANELQKVFDAVPTILVVVDERQRIRRFNRSGIEAFGKDEIEVLGRRLGEVLECVSHLDSKRGCGFGKRCQKCAIHGSILKCLKGGEPILNVEESVVRERIGGSPSYFRINVVPLNTSHKTWSVVSLDDISVRKRSEIESLRLHNSIARANLELKKTLEDLARSQSQLLESQKLEQIGLLASGLAHNLKTPLCGIKGYAQLLKMDHEDSHELDLIINEVEVMESIINNLMLKNRKDHENKEEILNLNDLIRVELEFLNANMFFKHNIKEKVSLDKNLPLVSGVYAHFSQAIINIVQNALDSMYNTQEKKLTIRTRHDDQYIFVDIGDTGSGISEEIRDRVFDIFFTTKPAANKRKGHEPFGTGLGLSSANFYIRQYGGTIDISSQVGKGTMVTIKVPHIHKRKLHSIHRVLIVDDSDAMVNVLTEACQDMGIEAYGVTNGEKAFELYNKLKPTVVVSDLCMPGLTGTEMMSEIRRINPSQRVVYISGYSENPEFREWLAQESQQPSLCTVMKKPFPLDSFKNVLEKMLND